MQRQITRGASANAGLIFHVFAQDSTSTSGAGKASVAFGSWSCRYIRNGEAISGAITPEDIATIGTYSAPTANTNIRIKAVDNTNMIGVYELQIHADWVNTTNSCQSLTIYLTASGVAVLPLQIPLAAFNIQDAVRGGLTALPNANADAAGGLPISDAGGLDLDAKLANTNEITAARMGALTDWINGGRLDLILDDILLDTGTTLDGRIPAALVGGRMDANVGAISSDATAADNAEAFFDGTGYAGTNNVIPTVTSVTNRVTANTDQVNGTAQTAGDIIATLDGIGTAGGSAINTDAATDNSAGGISGVTSGTTKVGTETGTFASTSFEDASYHVITHSGNAIDWVYQFLCGGGTTAIGAHWSGYLTGSNDTLTVSAWNHVGGAWQAIGTITGKAGTTNDGYNFVLYPRHIGTSAAELGKVYIRLHCSGMTSPVLNTDSLYVSYSVTSRSVGYTDGEVWVDTVSGVAGTESFVNGVADNPASSLANAITIATAVGLKGLHIKGGSSITLAGGYTNWIINGELYTLALGGQDISGSQIHGASVSVSGTATGTFPMFHECSIGTATLPPCALDRCGLTSTLTIGSAGDYFLVDCFSQIAGIGTPVINFAAVGATNMCIRRWSGGLTLNNLASGDVVSVDVVSGGTITLNGADATVVIRGTCNVVNNLTGSPTVTTTSVLNQTVLATPTNITAGTITTVSGNVAGSVGSVTGAVGSVTGNVGGNVVGSVGSVVAEVTPTAASKTGYRLSATGVDDVLDEVVEGTTTLRQSVRLANSANASKASGMGTTTAVIRDIGDTKDRITATVDANGNRTAITLDVT